MVSGSPPSRDYDLWQRSVVTMGSTTLGWDRRCPDPPKKEKKLDRAPTFYVGFWWRCGGGNRLRQTGYTCLIFFLEKGSNTPDQEIGPANFKLCVCGGNALPAVWLTSKACNRRGTVSLGHRVSGPSFWPSVRPEFFRFWKKCPKCKTYIWNAEMTKVIVRCLLLDWNHWMSVHAMNFFLLPMIIKNSLAWEDFFTHKSTFGVHYGTRSPGQLGLRIAGFPGHWVAASQNVTQFHV